MQFRALVAAATLALASYVQAEGFLQVDYPKGCADFCGPAVTASHACGERGPPCICNYAHMQKQIPLCEACTAAFSGSQNVDYHKSEFE